MDGPRVIYVNKYELSHVIKGSALPDPLARTPQNDLTMNFAFFSTLVSFYFPPLHVPSLVVRLSGDQGKLLPPDH